MKSYNQALNILKKSKILIEDEFINSANCLRRVNAQNVYSNVNYPSADNSSLDGFAIDANDTKNLDKKKNRLFKILGTLAAGSKPKFQKKNRFQSVEIMTGSVIPKGFNAIVPLEEVVFYPNKKNAKFIRINRKVKKKQNVRLKGSDYKKKNLLIKKGEIIESKHILALKTLGIKKVKVKKIPNILFFSSGKEITDKTNIPDWKVRDSNSDYIKSLSKKFLINFIKGKTLKDNDKDFFKKELKKKLHSNIDIIITSGAVSQGKFDYIPNVIQSFKLSNYFKGVYIRPGKPLLFAKIKNKPKVIFGLPGNPISSAACFRFFVYPYLLKSLGIEDEKPISALLKKEFIKKKFFTRFLKSRLNTTKNGKIEVEILNGQESFRVKSFVNSNTWTKLPSGKSKFKKNEIVECFLNDNSNKILT
tara:strand:- start:2572 stop:3825 length:1254 start_codon:yes stop_codon:yes gene_type:complete